MSTSPLFPPPAVERDAPAPTSPATTEEAEQRLAWLYRYSIQRRTINPLHALVRAHRTAKPL